MGNEALCVISVDFRLYELLDMKGVGISLAESGMMKAVCRCVRLDVRTP